MPAALLFLLKLLGGEIASRGALKLAGKLGSRAIATGAGKQLAEQAAKLGTNKIASKALPYLGDAAKHALIAGPAFIGADFAIENLLAPAEPHGVDSLAGPTRSTDDREIQNLIRAVQSAGGDEQLGDEDEVTRLLESMPNVRMLYA